MIKCERNEVCRDARGANDKIRKIDVFIRRCMSQVLSFHETLTAYKSVYFIATIVPVTLILLGKIIKPARPARTKARKEE